MTGQARTLRGALSPENERMRAMAAQIVRTHPPHPRYDFTRVDGGAERTWELEQRAAAKAHADFFEMWCERVKNAVMQEEADRP
jgi:hypothetical protein